MQLHSMYTPAILALALCVLPGCGGGGPDRPTMAPVSGTVTLDGKPLAGANIRFFSEDQSAETATGVTDGEGKFQLTTYNTNDGAVPGAYKVAVSMIQSGQAGNVPETEPDALNPPPAEMAEPDSGESSIPPQYLSPDTSPLKQTVMEGPNEFTIEL